MERRDFEQHPEDLEQAADWLRAQRPEVTALELDRIKQRARAQATRGERTARGRRPLATALTALVLTASLGGAFAIAGNGPPSPPSNSASSQGSAAKNQYKPPKPPKPCKPKPKDPPCP